MTNSTNNTGADPGGKLDLKPVQHNANLARQNKNAPDARKLVEDHARASWRAINGAAMRCAELNAEQARKAGNRAQRRLKKAIRRRNGLDERINMARNRDGDADAPAGKDVPFDDWNWYDKLIVIGCAAAMGLLLSLGIVNVATTILSSGIPVFLDQPYLAWMMGGLVPAAAMSIKSGYHLLDLDTSRRHYATSVFTLSGVLILIWIVLFALSFEGVSAGIDWGDFSDEDNLTSGRDWISTLRNITQILGEIVIGASLFLVIDRVQATYSSAYSAKNPRWVQANNRVEALEAPTAALLDKADALEARVHQIKAACEVFGGEAVAILRDMQSRKNN